MRRFLIAAVAATLVLAFAPSPVTPAAAAQEPFFTRAPVAGPVGSTVSLAGYCFGSPNGTASVSLAFPARSDALLPPVDSKTLPVAGDGRIEGFLTNNASQFYSGEDPIDMEVTVVCDNTVLKQPFASTARPVTATTSKIYTVPGPGPCGYAYVPFGEDPSIPCPTHLKGFGDNGSMNSTNDFTFTQGAGGSVAAGSFIDTGGPDIAVASGPGTDLQITTYAVAPPSATHNLAPFPGFKGGVSMAFADVTGDARDELLLGAGPGGGPHVKVFTLDGAWDQVGSFFAYGGNFHGGVSVAGVDVDGDGKAEIVTGAGAGGAPHVRAFKLDGTPVGPSFYAYAENFSGGVNVAHGNVTGDTDEEIVAAPGPGGGPHVRVFTKTGQPVGPGFYAYGADFAGGINVAVGNADEDVDLEIVTGPMGGGDPHLRVFTDIVGGFTSGGFYTYQRWPHGVKVAVAP